MVVVQLKNMKVVDLILSEDGDAEPASQEDVTHVKGDALD